MARYSDGILPDDQELRLTLDRYQEIMRLAPAAFNGLHKADEEACYDCAYIWKQYDRDALAEVIGQAEEMREQELGYNLAPAYTYDEEANYSNPTILQKKHLIQIGEPATSNIQLAVALTLSVGGVPNDPVVISVATTVTDTSEICVYYPGEDVQIHPSKIVITGGIATISIPRSRLVDPSIELNCDPPPEYTDDSNFLRTVDVKRCYNNPDHAFILCADSCDPVCVADTVYDACVKIENKRLSIINITSESCICCSFPRTRVSYKSGRKSSISTELLTARLAHTLLSEMLPIAQDPCTSCYKDDRIRDESGLVTPYDVYRGAIKAWMADSRAKVGQGGKFPKVR